MEIKLITTNVTTSGGGVGFRFLGNVEIAKPKPTIFGTTTKPKQTVGFRFNDVETTIDSNDEGYFEVYRDSDEPITKFNTNTNERELKTLDLSNLDTSQVTSMSVMFRGCMGLTSLDVSNWNTSQVTNMTGMFYGCNGLASLDVSHFDTSQVTGMSDMFNDCTSLTSLDLSKFDTSEVTDMGHMFEECGSLTSLDLSNFDTSKVTNMYRMFRGCASLRTIKINDEASANKLIAQIKTDLNKTATWNPETKIITIPE